MANVDRNAEDTTSEEETSEYGTEENSIDDSATQLDSRPGTPGKEVSSTPPPDEVSPTAIFTEQNTGIEETLAPVKESEKEDSSSKNLNMGEAGSSVVQKLSYPKKHPSTIAMIRDAVESLDFASAPMSAPNESMKRGENREFKGCHERHSCCKIEF